MAIWQNLNVEKNYALFGVNNFSPEIMYVYNFGHLEGLFYPDLDLKNV